MWDVETGRELRAFGGHKYPVYTIAISPDGRLIASGGLKILVRTPEADDAHLTLDERRRRVRSLAFSPDGSSLVAVGSDESTTIWDTATGENPGVLMDHDGPMRAVAFSPVGSRFATASDDRTIRIREAKSGDTLLILRGHTDDVLSLAFSADGSRLLSGSADGTARIWETGGRDERRLRRLEETRWREEATPLVEALFAEHLFLEDVLEALRAEPDLEAGLRDAALTIAALRAPELMSRLSETVTLAPGLDPELYDRARRLAEDVRVLAPGNDRYLLTAGMAEYRTGHYPESRAILEDEDLAESLPDASLTIPIPGTSREAARLLFLAMAYERTGMSTEAGQTLALAEQSGYARPEHAGLRALLTEAREVVVGDSDAPGGPSGGG